MKNSSTTEGSKMARRHAEDKSAVLSVRGLVFDSLTQAPAGSIHGHLFGKHLIMNDSTPNAESKYLASAKPLEDRLANIKVFKDAAQLVHRAKAMVVKPNGETATAAEIASELVREGYEVFIEKYINNSKSYNPDNK